eukprot:CAMPEP_0181249686 /NCGR_PEP_ID=MMETSP1096-20121128/45899_1 /TAXON_ID=156174 ORGANISM="Chrysochromulina ericina, Strain CCMP281" /NCGR_SAMPLE_ID=MMETSP1096 /ASSEMBLY_ACC=CAM_ASM_000453 /LENGTH=67 /DNA_ID=CAMNT_0023347065 /DNA_START=485 /DNA_END=684 /DNA_ORIENTATION=-
MSAEEAHPSATAASATAIVSSTSGFIVGTGRRARAAKRARRSRRLASRGPGMSRMWKRAHEAHRHQR